MDGKPAPKDSPRDPLEPEVDAHWYRALFDHHADGLLVLDPETARPIYFNDQVCRQLGYSREEFASLSINDIEATESSDEVGATIARVLREGKADFDTVHRTKLGDLRHVHVTAQLVQAGRRTLYQCTWRDITERKEAEAALQESQQKLQSIAEHVADLIALTDERGVITYASPASQALFGISPKEMTGRSFTAFLDPLSIPTALSVFQRAVARQNHARHLELRMRRVDGTTFLGELNGKAYEVGSEKGTLVTIRDITHRRQADEQLEVLKYSVEQAPAAAYWLAPDGRITYVNDAGCRALGYSQDELLRMTVFQVNVRATEERWGQVWQTLRERGVMTVESEHRRKDGSVFPVAITSVYFCYGGQEYCTGFAVDVTEQRRAARERQALEAQLAEAQRLEAIGRLAGGVAHDFNNMLSVIMGHAEMALNAIDPGAPLHADLLEIQAAAQRSAALTRQLLAFARRQTVAPKVIDLNGTVEGLLNMLRRLIGENVTLEWVPAPDLWRVRIDPSQVSQLLTNLAVNARDAIEGVGSVTISTANRTVDAADARPSANHEPGDYVLLSVRDDGAGMPREVVEHLFEPFFTTKAPGEGTGLGLATVYGIVQQNGGFIDVVTDPGNGALFDIWLPRWSGETEEAEAAPRPTAPGHETVLLVEDEPAILRLCRRMLDGLGYKVLAATTPGEAIALADQQRDAIDLLVSDVIMPEMNGRELARRLLPRHPGMKRLFMSGYTADVIAHHGILEDGVHFLQKPFALSELSQKVREALGRPD